MVATAKVTKKQLVLKAIKKLGTSASAKEANNYLQEHHGTKVSEAQYYTIRKQLVGEKAKPPQQNHDIDGVVALVSSARELIKGFGKEDAKKLIDLL